MNKLATFSVISLLCAFQLSHASNYMAERAKENGHKSCLAVISDVESFLTKPVNGKVGTSTVWASKDANSQIVSSTTELAFSAGTVLVDLIVAPTIDGHCSFSYTKTLYHDGSCMSAKEVYANDIEYKGDLYESVSRYRDGTVDTMLFPAGKGCTVQKKEIGIRQGKQS